jgi:hypothetical protein
MLQTWIHLLHYFFTFQYFLSFGLSTEERMRKRIDREYLVCLSLWLDLSVFLLCLVFLEDTFWVIEQLVGDLISGVLVLYILLELTEELEVIWFLFGFLHSLCLLYSWDREQQRFLYTVDLWLFVLILHLKRFISSLEHVGDLIRYGIDRLASLF